MTPAAALWPARAILMAFALSAAAFLALWLSRSPAPELPLASDGGEVRAERSYGQLPLAFEPNAGRTNGDMDFVSRSASGTVTLNRDGATIALGRGKRSEAIGLEPAGATATEPEALERLPGVVNDLRGDDPKRWRTGIPTFERVRYPGAWPGIDLDWYGNQRRLEYDLRLAPGADPDRIAFRIAGPERLRLAPNGDLLITAGTETVRQRAPVAFQPATSDAARTPVDADFALSGETVRFRLGPYDHRRPLVVDPLVLAYSTYLGGSGFDEARGIAVDSAGAAYVTGWTTSTDFNTVEAIEGDSASSDAFVSKLNPAGNALEYSTYLGGSDFDVARGIAVDSAGAAYVTGETGSSDFNAVAAIEGDSASTDAFVSKLNPAGDALEYSTYLGGASADLATAVAVDSAGAAYVTGTTVSTDFDRVGEIEGDGRRDDAFVSKLTPAGDALDYSTYLGGNEPDDGKAIAVDDSGAAYVTGTTRSDNFNTVGAIGSHLAGFNDAFVSKLVPDGNALAYSTYLGGNGSEAGNGIAVDDFGAAYVAGGTGSTDFDTVGAIEGDSASADAFVSKFTPAGDALEYSTYLGGNGGEVGIGIAVDDFGAAYVAGITGSTDFDSVGAIEGDSADGANDAFVSKLVPDGSALAYSTYLGGSDVDYANGIAVDSAGAAYVTGLTSSTDFNTVGEIEGDSASNDAFISKLATCTITGTAGDDTLIGTSGVDSICGLGGDDVIDGKQGDDEVLGGEGNDVLVGSLGDDTLDGGQGQDRAGYSAEATGGIDLNLATGVVTSANLGTDTIVKSTVERASGSAFADTLVGDGRANVLEGRDGDDTIAGGNGPDDLVGAGGADQLAGEGDLDKLEPGTGDDPAVSGGGGSDTLRYVHVAGGGIRIDLAAGIASPLGGSDSGTDTLAADIENAVGSPGPDELRAQLAGIASVLEGGDGTDSLDTSDGDALDSAKGGAGGDACATDAGDKRSSCP